MESWWKVTKGAEGGWDRERLSSWKLSCQRATLLVWETVGEITGKSEQVRLSHVQDLGMEPGCVAEVKRP